MKPVLCFWAAPFLIYVSIKSKLALYMYSFLLPEREVYSVVQLQIVVEYLLFYSEKWGEEL